MQFMDSICSKLTEKLGETLWENMTLKSNLETLKKNLKLLSGKKSDVEEKIKNAEISGKKKRKREVEVWVEQVNSIDNELQRILNSMDQMNYLRKFFNGGRATQLNVEVLELIKQSRHFGELLVDVRTRGHIFVVDKLSGGGVQQNVERILNLLESDEGLIIGIRGKSGEGKTALAMTINNMILETNPEKRVCWIKVSHKFSITMLQEKIARCIALDLCDEDDEDKRAAELKQVISPIGNNFILILDDVWKGICLQKLGDPVCLGGCKLILTTRSSEVCHRMGCQEIVEVGNLPPDEAWDLFKQQLKLNFAIDPRIEEIAKNMVKFCDGLPLGINVVARRMKGVTSIHEWRNEWEKLRDPNMVQDDEEDEVFRGFKTSFDRLDLNHQRCFLHCSLCLKDCRIGRVELVDRFISVGLVDKRKSRESQLDQGYSILNKLVKVSLLESVEESSQVKMHNLVRVMALRVIRWY